MLTERFAVPNRFVTVCVFIFTALMLIVDSGYSWGPALLFVFGLLVSFKRANWPTLSHEAKLIIFALAFFAIVWIVEALLNGRGLSAIDRPVRFLAAIIAFFALMRYSARESALWFGVIAGSVGAGGLALWEHFFQGVDRAHGFNHPIQFGNLSILLGLFCLSGLGWASQQNHRIFWQIALCAGFLFGLLASGLSGSRGGWISLPIALLGLFWCFRSWLSFRVLVGITVSVIIFCSAVYLLPQTGVKARLHQAVADLELHSEDKVNTPVGSRIEMWTGALHMIKDRPLLGWGELGYNKEMARLSELGIVDSGILLYEHPHNDFLNVTAKRGAVGLISLLILYFAPLWLFLSKCRQAEIKEVSVCAAGVVLCISYVSFGLSQSFLSHNSGVMVYAFMLVILASFHELRASSLTKT